MLLDRAAGGLEEDEIAVFDAGFQLQQLFDAKNPAFCGAFAQELHRSA